VACGETPRTPDTYWTHSNERLLPEIRRGWNGGCGPKDRGTTAHGRLAGDSLARRLQIRHAGNQGGGARRLGRRPGPGHGPVRLFGPRRIGRRLRGRHDRALARGQPGGVRRLLPGPPDRGWLVDGGVDRPPDGARAGATGGGGGDDRRLGPDRPRGRLHRGADVETAPPGPQPRDRGDRRLEASLRLWGRAPPDQPQPDSE